MCTEQSISLMQLNAQSRKPIFQKFFKFYFVTLTEKKSKD